MNVIERFRVAPNTIAEAKKGIFAPSLTRSSERERIDQIVFADDLVEVSLHGYRLNQLHRDILDAALYYGDSSIEKKIENVKNPVRLFTLYSLQKYLNYKTRFNNKWLIEKIEELKRTTIKIKVKDGSSIDSIEFNIIDVVRYSTRQKKYAILLSEFYMNFFADQISVNYKHCLPDILKLKSGQAKALARYVLTHKSDFKIKLDTLMRKIGIVDMTEQAFRYARRRILADAEGLKKLNISIEKATPDQRTKRDYIVSYIRMEGVKIYYPDTLNDRLTLL